MCATPKYKSGVFNCFWVDVFPKIWGIFVTLDFPRVEPQGISIKSSAEKPSVMWDSKVSPKAGFSL